MKKILFLLTAVLLITGLGLGARVLAGDEQLFMQVSPRTWVLDEDESVGGEAVDIHLAIPLSEVMNEDNLVSVVVYNEDYSKKIDTLSISIGADMRGDVVIKFVPNYSALEPGDVLNVEVEGVCEINADPEYDCLFEGIEVMDAGFVMEEESTVKKN